MVNRTGYTYSIRDDDDREILAFHWHPGEDAFDPPHVHLAGGAGELRRELQKAHIPTGPVAIEQVVLFLIREFTVAPRRQDYMRVLQR